jgi:hypothetical protein
MSINALMADDATTAAPRVHISPSDGSNGKLHGLKRRRLVQHLPETRAVIDNPFSIQQHLLSHRTARILRARNPSGRGRRLDGCMTDESPFSPQKFT